MKSQIAYARLTDISKEQTSAESLFIPAPIWSVSRNRHIRDRGSTIGENFIDDDSSTKKTTRTSSLIQRLRHNDSLHNLSARTDDNTEWTIPLDIAYDALVKEVSTTTSTEMAMRDLAEAISQEASDSTFCSISGCLPHLPIPQRYDNEFNVISTLESMLAANNADLDQELTVTMLGSAITLGLASAFESLSLDQMHEHFAERYTAALSNKLPAEVHEHQASLVDRIVWQVTLASLCVRPRVPEEPEAEGSDPNQALSIESNAAAVPSTLQLDSQTVGTHLDEAEAVPEEEHNLEMIKAAAQQAESIDAVVSRLQRLTTVANPPIEQSNTIALTLTHWQLHSDPAVYDYEEKNASQRGTINLEGSAMSAEVVQELKKRKEKEAKKEVKRRKIAEKANQASQQSLAWTQETGPFASSQVLPGSSQFLSQDIESSSQAVESQMTTASQAVPGRYIGARPGPGLGRKAGRGKVRRAGF